VSPHLEATLTISNADPGAAAPSEESCPVSVFTGMSYMVTLLSYRAPGDLAQVAPGDGGDERVHRVLVGRQRSG
jgi:hypothetical protein